jgi:hypothetical protein
MIYLIVVILLVALAILWLVGRAGSRVSSAEKTKAKTTWQRIVDMADSDDEHALTKAIFEADKLLDWSMGLVGVRGNGLGEKLKIARSRVVNIDAVWRAHKLRNQLAHEMDARISRKETREALAAFERAIKGFGLL